MSADFGGFFQESYEDRISEILPTLISGVADFTAQGDIASKSGTTFQQIIDSNGIRTLLGTGSVSLNDAWVAGVSQYTRNNFFQFYCKFKIKQTTNIRAFFGLTSLPPSTMINFDDPPTGHFVGLQYSSGLSSNFRYITKNGSTINPLIGPTADINIHHLYIWAIDSTKIYIQLDNNTRVSLTVNLPGFSTLMRYVVAVETQTSAAREIELGKLAVTTVG